MSAQVFDPRICKLGEGPLWHPERKQLFWFDILGKKLLSRTNGKPLAWSFGAHVSAAGWVDKNTLLIASATGLYRFDLATGQQGLVARLEADNPATRSNDGRADPWGGFWIGTMGKNAEAGQGAIYRFYRGEVRQLVSNITISNSICFSPDRTWAYYTDTPERKIMRQRLSAGNGWPVSAPEIFLDLTRQGLNPDGSVVDARGCLWNAQWGAGTLRQYSPEGALMATLRFPAAQITCPAFGGAGLNRLFATSAAVDDASANAGQTYFFDVKARGQHEHQVIL